MNRCTKVGDLVRVLGGVHRNYKFRVSEITERGELKGHAVHPNVELYCGDVEVVRESEDARRARIANEYDGNPRYPFRAKPIETGPLALTADTITDEQIRELLASDEEVEVTACLIALQGPTQPQLNRGWTRAKARARCAEILNARKKEG